MAQLKDLKAVFVECSPSDGMFDSEVAVVIDTLDGVVSLFADRGLVEQTSEGIAALKTYASLATDHLAGPLSLLLPSEAFETGTRWIRVAPNKVRVAS